MERIAYIITVLSLIGTVANSLQKRWCFYIWHIFYTFGKTRRKLCDDCVKARKNKRNLDIYKNVYNKHTPKKDKPRGLNDFMREVEEYNRSHGKCLTYGEYTALTNK